MLAYPLLGVALAALVAVHIPGIGYTAGGAARWLRLGGVNFQPSELARFALVIYLAFSMSRKMDRIKEFSVGFLPHVLVVGVFMALVAIQPDFGSVMILGTITWLMLFMGGVRLRHLLSTLALLLPIAYFFMVQAEYRVKRLMSFLDPWQYPASEGYQIIHSLMAFGTGGIWGSGVGKGYQKLFYLPEPHTDFIFCSDRRRIRPGGGAGYPGALRCSYLWRGHSTIANQGPGHPSACCWSPSDWLTSRSGPPGMHQHGCCPWDCCPPKA